MNFRLLIRVLGLLLLMLAGSMFICLGYALWLGEQGVETGAVEAFGVAIAASASAGGLMVWTGRKAGREIFRREAIAIVGLGWLVCGAFGALPFILCEPGLGVVDAFFESVSGFTTTGATVIPNLDVFPRSILLWRAWTQWLGGLGILVLFVAVLSYLGAGSKSLFHHESSAKTGEGLKSKMRDIALQLWRIYVVLSVVCCAGLMALGMSFYDAVYHTFTSISTGGFSPRNESIAAYGSYGIEAWLCLFMLLGGMSFVLYAWLLRGRWERWQKEEEAKVFLGVLGALTVAMAADLVWRGEVVTIGESIRAAVFQVVSIMTTTGYVTEDFNGWPAFSRVLLVLSMFVGGCAGSTAGGIKVGRFILLWKVLRQQVIAAFRPNQVITLRLNGNVVDEEMKLQTVFFITLAGLATAIGTTVVSLLEPGLDAVSSLTAVVASLFNIGPGLGAVGPTSNFAGLASVTKVFLSFLMVLGRLEFFALLVLFAPSLWRRY